LIGNGYQIPMNTIKFQDTIRNCQKASHLACPGQRPVLGMGFIVFRTIVLNKRVSQFFTGKNTNFKIDYRENEKENNSEICM